MAALRCISAATRMGKAGQEQRRCRKGVAWFPERKEAGCRCRAAVQPPGLGMWAAWRGVTVGLKGLKGGVASNLSW